MRDVLLGTGIPDEVSDIVLNPGCDRSGKLIVSVEPGHEHGTVGVGNQRRLRSRSAKTGLRVFPLAFFCASHTSDITSSHWAGSASLAGCSLAMTLPLRATSKDLPLAT